VEASFFRRALRFDVARMKAAAARSPGRSAFQRFDIARMKAAMERS